MIMKNSVFWDITPYHWKSPDVSEEHVTFIFSVCATCFMLAPCLAYSSILKMEAACYSETLVDFQRTTRRYIAEDTFPRMCYGFQSKQEWFLCFIVTRKVWTQESRNLRECLRYALSFLICLALQTPSVKNVDLHKINLTECDIFRNFI
jgi:hypothetical protein